MGRRHPRIFRSEEHTSELQSRGHLVCRLLLEKKNRGLRGSMARLSGEHGEAINACSIRAGYSRLKESIVPPRRCSSCYVFFFNDTATTEIYTLSLHDALPI